MRSMTEGPRPWASPPKCSAPPRSWSSRSFRMLLTDDDAISNMVERAAQALSAVPSRVEGAASSSRVLATKIAGYAHQADHFAEFALLPLCLALLITYEHTRSLTDGAPFRVGYVCTRIGV